MRAAMLAGAGLGASVYLLIRVLLPPRPSLLVTIGRYDAERLSVTRAARAAAVRLEVGPSGRLDVVTAHLGRRLLRELNVRGVTLTRITADLAVLDRTPEGFIATSALLAVAGLALAPAVAMLLWAAGIAVPVAVPAVVGVALSAGCALLAAAAVRAEAGLRRREFRRAVGAFLDLVAMSLAGGRGVPEALVGSASIGHGWAFARLRTAIVQARVTGRTPWAALGDLGEEMRVDELRDLSGSLALVGEEGARVRESLTVRAGSLRRRQLADAEAAAGEQSQSLILAQVVIGLGALLFIGYPAVAAVLRVG